mmetsp:Transcript_23137/g.65589  ORF Transcript_23137/g.65589 Transcript_23137/m.65589 type:complete len:274 (-) Transcript_23137:228-1049(-)
MEYVQVSDGMPADSDLSIEDGLNVTMSLHETKEAQACLGAGGPLPNEPPVSSRSRRCLLFVVPSATLLGAFLLLCSHLPGHTVGQSLGSTDADLIEQKFYDSNGSYWQAPQRGISTSEVWSDCNHPHMSTCGKYCCCDADYYWKSPRTIYSQGKKILRSGVAAGTAAAETAAGTTAAVEGAALGAAKVLSRAALASMMGPGQACVHESRVPPEMVSELAEFVGGEPIPGSGDWATCSLLTPNSYSCGTVCCCDRHFLWDSHKEKCLDQRQPKF